MTKAYSWLFQAVCSICSSHTHTSSSQSSRSEAPRYCYHFAKSAKFVLESAAQQSSQRLLCRVLTSSSTFSTKSSSTMCRVRDAVLRLLILLQAGYSEGFSLLLPLLSGEYKESPEPRGCCWRAQRRKRLRQQPASTWKHVHRHHFRIWLGARGVDLLPVSRSLPTNGASASGGQLKKKIRQLRGRREAQVIYLQRRL